MNIFHWKFGGKTDTKDGKKCKTLKKEKQRREAENRDLKENPVWGMKWGSVPDKDSDTETIKTDWGRRK